jgi:transposase
MNDAKYIGMDVHQATISAAVLDSDGNLVMEVILETKTETILQFLGGIRGSLHVTFEEGTWSAWLHDLLKPHVTQVVVCDTRKTGLGKNQNRSDRRDARGLARLLYRGELESVYHGEHGLRSLRELARTHLAITRDLIRVMARVKAIYRSWGIPCTGQQVYALRHRAEWLGRLAEQGVRRRAEFYYQQFDALAALRQQARHELLVESQKHSAVQLLRRIPSIGPIRAALLVAIMQTPHRFRTKRQLWAYIGLALRTYTTGEYRFEGGQLKHSKKALAIRGLNRNYNHDLKNIFKGAATWAASNSGPFQSFYESCLARGMKPHLARLTLARKIAAITLLIWKKGVCFDAKHLKPQAA